MTQDYPTHNKVIIEEYEIFDTISPSFVERRIICQRFIKSFSDTHQSACLLLGYHRAYFLCARDRLSNLIFISERNLDCRSLLHLPNLPSTSASNITYVHLSGEHFSINAGLTISPDLMSFDMVAANIRRAIYSVALFTYTK